MPNQTDNMSDSARTTKNSKKASTSGLDCIDEMTRILKRLDALEKENRELKNRMTELEKKQAQSEEKIGSKMLEAIKKEGDSYVDKLKKNLDSPPGKVVTVKQIADMQDRRLNLIFRGIRECDNIDGQERKNHDWNQVLNVVTLAGLNWQDFKNAMLFTRRLGKADEQHKFRPLLVRLSSQELRQKALTCNKQLRLVNLQNQEKEAEGKTRYRIDADLTKEQKDNLDKMWEEARTRTTEAKNGVRYFVIGQENPVMRSQKVSYDKNQEV